MVDDGEEDRHLIRVALAALFQELVGFVDILIGIELVHSLVDDRFVVLHGVQLFEEQLRFRFHVGAEGGEAGDIHLVVVICFGVERALFAVCFEDFMSIYSIFEILVGAGVVLFFVLVDTQVGQVSLYEAKAFEGILFLEALHGHFDSLLVCFEGFDSGVIHFGQVFQFADVQLADLDDLAGDFIVNIALELPGRAGGFTGIGGHCAVNSLFGFAQFGFVVGLV